MHDVDVAILGAGPHGLSAAVHLQRKGIDVKVFGSPMSFWRTMPHDLQLRSNMSATNMIEPRGPLSLQSYMSSTGRTFDYPVPLAEFISYGMWVQRKAAPDVDERLVTNVDVAGDGFRLDLIGGDHLSAGRAIIAAGIAPFCHTPEPFLDLPSHLVSHSGSQTDMSVHAGKKVAVVGGGQSALECAALMHEQGADVEVLVRSQRVIWLHRRSRKRMLGPVGELVYAPTDVGPLWYSRLVAAPDLFRRLPRNAQTRVAYRSIRPACSHFVRVRLDGVKLTLNTEVLRAEPSESRVELTLSDGSHREVDHLLLGTGYRVDVTRYGFLGPRLLGSIRSVGGYPVLGRGLESSVPGLYIMGAPAAWSFGPIMRFVSGSWYAGTAIARSISLSPSRSTSVSIPADQGAASATVNGGLPRTVGSASARH